jgi:hypothetical protein
MDTTTRGAARAATLAAVPLALLAGVLAFWLLGGFPGRESTGPVKTSVRPLNPDQAAACRALVAKLPATVDKLHRRPVTAGADQSAAYGDPPIVLTCGAPEVPSTTTDALFEISGVCWHPFEGPEATVWTTMDRPVPVAVTVPGKYQPPGQYVVEFSGPIGATMPVVAKRCQ